MFAIAGITGKVGAVAATALLNAGHQIRAVVRSEEKGAAWKARGCEIAVVPDAGDQTALERAFERVEGLFLMNPPNYDSDAAFTDSRHRVAAAARAISKVKPARVVLLSTVGAQVREFNLLNWGGIYEHALAETGIPVAFLRAAWFMENASWDVAAAREGQIHSHLQPLDHAIDRVSVKDIGRVAAELLQETWTGTRTIELTGPRKYSANDEAAGFAAALGRSVEAVAIPRETWEAQFRAQGMQHPAARIRMLDGFNEGWIDFERNRTEQRTGTVTFETVLRELITQH
ncbi:NmrA family transcriptional regulator [Pseudolabrys taiwanensis]|uniref:NmrA family transcriptional regulator n=2 Tax=Pseudolabrys taiwanensis TaxID=331696 RepID=A0A346A4K7_9HYPH|nr:NmrA family transcriptional regulator [Pseudolabrys taiwanensis]